jgi:hypothetical protein
MMMLDDSEKSEWDIGRVDGKLYTPEGDLVELYEGKWMRVLNGDREGYWRYHDHYDRDGYCDNPARGY